MKFDDNVAGDKSNYKYSVRSDSQVRSKTRAPFRRERRHLLMEAEDVCWPCILMTYILMATPDDIGDA